MGKPTGFMEWTRELPTDRDPIERVKDWDEFHEHFPVVRLQEQGGRCMDCGVPFCHTGELIGGMAAGCPINNLIPEWNDLVYRGLWREALERLHRTNNFPEFTGRVCPAPCEGSCVLGMLEPAVTIKNNECSIVDKGWDEGWIASEQPQKRTGKKVAIIGSGPSGLSCAMQLNRAGHEVTVYERDDRPGGLLMYGIPNMKLEKWRVLRRIKQMEDEGVRFITNTHVGIDIQATEIHEQNDAVAVCTGATKPRDLPIEGREFGGIHFAMDFLRANTRSLLNSRHEDGNFISAAGKNVIVIGGGDTGTDCVGTSIRHGCETLCQFEILPRPPDERADNNPWPEWPKIYRLDYGQEEAKARFGDDPRTYLIMTQKFVADEDGNVNELHTVDIEWDFSSGRPTPKPIEGTERVWPAELVLLAMGFLGPEDAVIEQLDIERDERSNAKAEHEKYYTSVEGIFAAGDCRRGQSLVVWAINEGRGCAREVDRWLMGQTDLP
ncbi:MAG: glutamate synthase subunit beta [Planctomycetota bacterium]|jgi:glutamate synthase (NADPH/NADH) small chain|nr:glutamate synthase subunit beta [Planctomycetota bacterium]MDP7133146.1 glutamate synthase subunit beta [Planctomycetota bacterium]MDP7250600.1 glutamate synthase subunit beta [Planctomycetota bacterium]